MVLHRLNRLNLVDELSAGDHVPLDAGFLQLEVPLLGDAPEEEFLEFKLVESDGILAGTG